MIKDFDNWNILKKIAEKISTPPSFNEREIWWCRVGVNIGSEILGKGEVFSRPVLILKKFSKNSFIAVPLTSKIKVNFGYHKFTFKEKEICAALSEIRKMDSKRLIDKIGKLPDGKFAELKAELRRVIFDPLFKKGRRT
jgi:mRNA interferase MazF